MAHIKQSLTHTTIFKNAFKLMIARSKAKFINFEYSQKNQRHVLPTHFSLMTKKTSNIHQVLSTDFTVNYIYDKGNKWSKSITKNHWALVFIYFKRKSSAQDLGYKNSYFWNQVLRSFILIILSLLVSKNVVASAQCGIRDSVQQSFRLEFSVTMNTAQKISKLIYL